VETRTFEEELSLLTSGMSGGAAGSVFYNGTVVVIISNSGSTDLSYQTMEVVVSMVA